MIIISFTPFMMRPVLLAQFKTVSTSIIQTRVYIPTLLNTHLVTHPAPVPCTPHTSSFSPPMYAKGCQRQTYTAERIKNKYRRETKDDTWTDFFSILRDLSLCRPEPDLVFLPTLLVNGCLLVSAEACSAEQS